MINTKFIKEKFLKDKQDLKNDFYTTIDGKIYVTVRKDFTINNAPCVSIWVGNKAFKPRYRYRFTTIEKRENWVKETVNRIIENKNCELKEKQEIKNQLKQYKTQTKIGDIFHVNYGYNMILNEFWKVTDVKGKKITLKKLRMSFDEVCFMQYNVKPILDKTTGDTITKMLQVKQYSTNSKPIEYLSMDYGHVATNVTENVLRGETWLQDEAD